jgi:hypothetical protein
MIQIKEIWGEEIISLCKEYNTAATTSNFGKCREIVGKLLSFLKFRNWKLS